MTTDEAVQIIERYIEWDHCEQIDALPLKDWLGTDIVRLIELLDAELQQRTDFAAAANDAIFDDYGFDYGHDPDPDDNGICRICGGYEPE